MLREEDGAERKWSASDLGSPPGADARLLLLHTLDLPLQAYSCMQAFGLPVASA